MSDVILEFTGSTDGAQVFRHPVTSRNIRAGRNLAVRYITVSPEEVDWLLTLGIFRIAHSGTNKPVSVAVKQPVKRIEPIIQQSAEESTSATAVSNPSETIVSFDDAELDSSISWMTAEDPVAPIVEEISVEQVPEEPVVLAEEKAPVVDKKIQRGRPRN